MFRAAPAWNVMAFATAEMRARFRGASTRAIASVLVGKLAEILRDQRPARKVTAMFIDMAFGSPIYERLRALGFNNVFETNFCRLQTENRQMRRDTTT
jgi:hypothetical protein